MFQIHVLRENNVVSSISIKPLFYIVINSVMFQCVLK